jgi:hypothetical protein
MVYVVIAKTVIVIISKKMKTKKYKKDMFELNQFKHILFIVYSAIY